MTDTNYVLEAYNPLLTAAESSPAGNQEGRYSDQ